MPSSDRERYPGCSSSVDQICSSPFLDRTKLAIYRSVCALFLLYTIVAGALVKMPAPYCMYLTNWMVMLNFLYFSTATVAVVHSAVSIRKAAFRLNAICLPNAATVCLLFWVVVAPRLKEMSSSISLTWYSYFRLATDHGGTLVLLLIDFYICETRFRMSDVVWPALVFVYIPASAVYTLTNQPIYPGLTYKDLVSVGFVMFASVTTLAAFTAIVYLVPQYKLAEREKMPENAIPVLENSVENSA